MAKKPYWLDVKAAAPKAKAADDVEVIYEGIQKLKRERERELQREEREEPLFGFSEASPLVAGDVLTLAEWNGQSLSQWKVIYSDCDLSELGPSNGL